MRSIIGQLSLRSIQILHSRAAQNRYINWLTVRLRPWSATIFLTRHQYSNWKTLNDWRSTRLQSRSPQKTFGKRFLVRLFLYSTMLEMLSFSTSQVNGYASYSFKFSSSDSCTTHSCKTLWNGIRRKSRRKKKR